jgi:hypothetical protein
LGLIARRVVARGIDDGWCLNKCRAIIVRKGAMKSLGKADIEQRFGRFRMTVVGTVSRMNF